MHNYTKEEIKNLANLAKIAIKDSEIDDYAKKISNIINLIEKIKTIDLKNIPPMSHPLENINQRLREDKVTETNQRELLQKNAPLIENGLYLVPSIIE